MSGYTPPPNGFRTFVIVWVTQSLSVIGSALTFFAMNIWLMQALYPLPEQKPQLAWAISATSLAYALPTVVLAPLTGAWADRYDRRRIMLSMNLLSGLLSLLLLLLIVSGMLHLWSLIVIIALFAALGSFHGAAFDTAYAMLVPERQLPRANGMMQTMWSLSSVLSPGIAAALIMLPGLARQGRLAGPLADLLALLADGSALAIGLDALSFFLAGVVLIFLFIPSPQRRDLETQAKTLWADIREGGHFIWQRRALIWLLAAFTVSNFVIGTLNVFENLLVRFNLSADWTARGFTLESALAVISSAAGLGGLAGGILMSVWGGLKKKRVLGVLGAMLLISVFTIFIGLSAGLYLTAVLFFCTYAMTPISSAHSQTIWQSLTPHHLQGRVFAVRRVIAQFTWPLSTALAGLLGSLFNPGGVMVVLAAIFLVFIVTQFFNPVLLRVEGNDTDEEQTVPVRVATTD